MEHKIKDEDFIEIFYNIINGTEFYSDNHPYTVIPYALMNEKIFYRKKFQGEIEEGKPYHISAFFSIYDIKTQINTKMLKYKLNLLIT